MSTVVKLLEYFNDGYTYVVDIDLEKFFDNVHHDKLMYLVHGYINDGDTESLIQKYLSAGVMVREQYEATEKGTPQEGHDTIQIKISRFWILERQ